MLSEDDDTISTLRQALARWEHGDQAGALEIQSSITSEHDARELQRQLKHLEAHVLLREKQMLDLKEEVARGPPGSAPSQEGEGELAAAHQRIAKLEKEVVDLTQKQALHSQKEGRRASQVESAASSERALLSHKVAQLEAALAMHKRVMETQQREVEDAKASSKPRATSLTTPSLSTSQDPLSAESQSLRVELQALQAACQAKDEEVRRKDEEVRQVKEKAKEKLNTASEAVKKMKGEYAMLRTAYAKVKGEGVREVGEVREKMQRKLRGMQEVTQSMRGELQEVKAQMQAMAVSLPTTLRPLITRQVNALCDHFKSETASLTVAYRKEQLARKALFNQLQELKGNIRVYCRVRPLSHREKDSDVNSINFPEEGSLTITNPEKKTTNAFEFDQVFNPSSTQEEVFSEVADLVTSVMDGYNCCIFAYGQTGSGKTHTMAGGPGNPGVNIRALDRLFVIAQERVEDTEYNIKISLLEIYNERIQDLLGVAGAAPLKAVQGPHGMTVQDLTYVPVTCKDEVLSALERGSKQRKVSSTAMNADSSRSHLILSVYVMGRSRFALPSGVSKEVMGKLHLIDLAGSERISRSGVVGEGLKEAQAINSSLSALGNCIAARANKAAHVPYRDSALTYLLQDSLEKNSKTLMFVQVSPNGSDAGESVCSLRFAERVRKVELGKASANVKK